MNGLITHWRTCLLGAAAGLFSSGLCLLAYRVDEYGDRLREIEARARAIAEGLIGCGYVGRGPFWWVYATGTHIVLYVVASLVVHRFLSKRVTSVFLLWQCIGLLVIAGWGLLTALSATLRVVFDAMPFHLISPFSPDGLKFTALALAANVIYGTVIQSSANRYKASV